MGRAQACLLRKRGGRPPPVALLREGGSPQGEPCGLKPNPFILSSPPDKTGYHLELSFSEVPTNAVSHLGVQGVTGRWTHCTDEEGTLWGFPGGSVVKYPPANAGDAGSAGLIPGWGRSPGGVHGSPLQHSCLENPLDRGAWRASVHSVAELDSTERSTQA